MTIKQISKIAKLRKPTANSEHQEMINNVLEFMGDKRYAYWCGRLKGYTPNEIYDKIKECKKWKINPQALFNKMLKK